MGTRRPRETRMSDARILDGTTALIDGRQAYTLAVVLQTQLRSGASLREVLTAPKVSPRNVEAAVEAAATLAEAGYRWRHNQPAEIPGNAETAPDDHALTWEEEMLTSFYIGLILTSEDAEDQRWSNPHVAAWVVRREDDGTPVCEPALLEIGKR